MSEPIGIDAYWRSIPAFDFMDVAMRTRKMYPGKTDYYYDDPQDSGNEWPQLYIRGNDEEGWCVIDGDGAEGPVAVVSVEGLSLDEAKAVYLTIRRLK